MSEYFKSSPECTEILDVLTADKDIYYKSEVDYFVFLIIFIEINMIIVVMIMGCAEELDNLVLDITLGIHLFIVDLNIHTFDC